MHMQFLRRFRKLIVLVALIWLPLVVNKVEVLAALTCIGNEIDYSNFKSKIGKTEDQRDKLDAYHEIWGVMAKVQRGQRD